MMCPKVDYKMLSAEAQMGEDKELKKFWKEVFIASIRSSRNDAAYDADRAVKAYKSRWFYDE